MIHWDYNNIYDIVFNSYNIKKYKTTEANINNIFAFDIETSNGFRLDSGKVIPFSHKRWKEWCAKNQLALMTGRPTTDKPCEYKNPVSLMYVWQCAVESFDDRIEVFMGRTWEDFKEFLEKLDDAIVNFSLFGQASISSADADIKTFMLSKKVKETKLHIYVHNLGFEFQHIRNVFPQIQNVFARSMRKPFRAEVKMAHTRIVFHDTLCLTQKKLETWAKDENLPVQKAAGDLDYLRIRTPLTPLTQKEIGYCVNDVVTMIYGVQKYRYKYGRKLSNIPMTQTGEVRIVCRDKISDKNRKWAESCFGIDHSYSFDFFNRLVRAFAGGWTHASERYAGQTVKNVVCYDFASSYPSVMTTRKFPISEFKEVDAQRIDYLNQTHIEDRDSVYMITVKVYDFNSNMWNSFWSSSKCVETGELYLDNGKIIAGDYAMITMTDLDWDIFSRAYDIDRYEIIEAYEAEADYLPLEMIETILNYYAEKTSLKGTGNESKYIAAKQFINSIYGCCVTKIITDEIVYSNFGWDKTPINETEFMDKMKMPESGAAIEKEISEKFTTYQIGVWIPAWARHNLWDAIFQLDEKIVYCDTDSVKGLFDDEDIQWFSDYNIHVGELQKRVADHYGFDVVKYSPLTVKGKAKQLGIFDREDDCEEFKSIGAKRYAASHNGEVETTIAGLPRKAGTKIIKSVDELNDGIIWSPKQSGKLMAHYIDNMQSTEWHDKYGNVWNSNDQYGIMLEPIGFDMSLAEEYRKLIETLNGKTDSDYFNITKIIRDYDLTDCE